MVRNSNYNPAPQIRKITTFFLIFLQMHAATWDTSIKKKHFPCKYKKKFYKNMQRPGTLLYKNLFATIKIISNNYKKFLRNYKKISFQL